MLNIIAGLWHSLLLLVGLTFAPVNPPPQMPQDNAVHVIQVAQPTVPHPVQQTTNTEATMTVSSSAQSSISVPGMSKYTDPDLGFSFWYPSGWSIKGTNSGLLIGGPAGLLGGVNCPPVAKGFEGSVPTTDLMTRVFQRNSIIYSISYQEYGGEDANGNRTPTDTIFVSVYPASSTWNGGKECLLTVGGTGPMSTDVISGIKEIYNSWQ